MPDQFSLLLEWRRNEAATRGLAKLPHDFYPTTAAYLAEVRRSYEADMRENPSGRKGDMSRQTYQRASQVARDIVEARTQKILGAAFQASIGGTRDLPNALPDERTIHDRIVATLLDHRRRVSPYLESAAAGPPNAPVSPPAPPAMPGAASPAPAPTPSPKPPLAPSAAYVRILKDGRPIEVGNETIDLRADDVLSLPEEKARLLVAAKVAEPIVPASTARPVT
jgi:DNA replication initiation complex subunit (GINS family)